MINELIDLLIDLAVNPNSQISEEILNQHCIIDDELRSALLNKDKHALMHLLDPKRLTLMMTNNATIFSIIGDIETEPAGQAGDVTLSGYTQTEPSDQAGDVIFVLKSESEYDLTLINNNKPSDKYKARVVSGELVGRPISSAKEVGESEGERPSSPPAYQG